MELPPNQFGAIDEGATRALGTYTRRSTHQMTGPYAYNTNQARSNDHVNQYQKPNVWHRKD